MTQDKMRRIITACVSAFTAFLVFLLSYIIYQWISIAVLNNKIEDLKADIAEKERTLEGKEKDLEYYQTEIWLQKAYQELAELEGKK